MLEILHYKSIAGIGSMQEMSEQFNDEEISKTVCIYWRRKYLLHHVTENEYLDSMELEEIKKNLAYQELVEKDGCTCSYGGFKRIVV